MNLITQNNTNSHKEYSTTNKKTINLPENGSILMVMTCHKSFTLIHPPIQPVVLKTVGFNRSNRVKSSLKLSKL